MSDHELVGSRKDASGTANSQTKNQASRRNIDERYEREAGCKRVRFLVQKTNRIISSKAAELPDGIDQSECGGGRRFA
jgi:hypothetical protein